MITFDPIKHEYFLEGRKVPSVTQILSSLTDFSKVNLSVLEYAREFGTGVHLACEFNDNNDLAELPEVYVPYLEGWKKFLNDYKVEILEVEKMVYSKNFRYAGTVDRIAKIKNKITVIDIKSGQKNPVFALQLSGYKIALEEMGVKPKARMTVYLKPEGYSVQEYKDTFDDAVFLSALYLHNWKINNKIKEN